MSAQVVHDASWSACEACGDQWDAANHAALAGAHRKRTGHATVTHTDKTIRHGAQPEMNGQLALATGGGPNGQA